VKRDEGVKGARECRGKEGDFNSLSLSMLITLLHLASLSLARYFPSVFQL